MTEATRAHWRTTKFAWGTEDCVISVTDHVRRITGIDPAAPWRGTYGTEDGAKALWKPYGGVLALFKHGMALAGFEEGQRHYGCPVVVAKCGLEIAGIDMGDRVMFRTENGIADLPLDVAAAWPML